MLILNAWTAGSLAAFSFAAPLPVFEPDGHQEHGVVIATPA